MNFFLIFSSKWPHQEESKCKNAQFLQWILKYDDVYFKKNHSILNWGDSFIEKNIGFIHNMLPPPYCVTGPQWVKEWHTMLDPAKPIDGSQPGYQTISINRWTISEVDALPCGILLGRLHHGSTEQVSVAGSLFCLLPMWWVNYTWTAFYKDLALQEDSRYTRNTIYISLLQHHTTTGYVIRHFSVHKA